MPDVELQRQCRQIARVADQLQRLGDRRDDRPLLATVALVRLERDSQVERRGLRGDLPQPLNDDPARSVRIAPGAGAGQADDPARPKRRQPVQRAEDRVDALPGIIGAAEQRQRKNGGHGRNRRGAVEPGALEQKQRVVVGAVAELLLPDADPVEPGGTVCLDVVGEARRERGDLRDRDPWPGWKSL